MTDIDDTGEWDLPHATRWTLREHAEPMSMVRLEPGAALPGWANGQPMTSVTWSAGGTTVVCPTRCIPDDIPGQMFGPFTAFTVEGMVELGTSGVLAELLRPLAATGIAVFVITTTATNWMFVPSQLSAGARAAWTGAKHQVVDA